MDNKRLHVHLYQWSFLQLDLFIPGSQTRRKLLSILDAIDFSQDYPEPLKLEFFNPTLVEQVAAACETRNDHGTQLTNVRRLYRILTSELNTPQGLSMGQRPLMMQVSKQNFWNSCQKH